MCQDWVNKINRALTGSTPEARDAAEGKRCQLLELRDMRQRMENSKRQVIKRFLEATQHGTIIQELGKTIRTKGDLIVNPEALEMVPSQRKDLQALIKRLFKNYIMC